MTSLRHHLLGAERALRELQRWSGTLKPGVDPVLVDAVFGVQRGREHLRQLGKILRHVHRAVQITDDWRKQPRIRKGER